MGPWVKLREGSKHSEHKVYIRGVRHYCASLLYTSYLVVRLISDVAVVDTPLALRGKIAVRSYERIELRACAQVFLCFC